jgi:hypothetical protein
MEMRDGSPSIARWSCPQQQVARLVVMGAVTLIHQLAWSVDWILDNGDAHKYSAAQGRLDYISTAFGNSAAT